MRYSSCFLFSACILLLTDNSVLSQTTHFHYKANTGNNAVVVIPSSIKPTICENTITIGDEIGIFTPDGLCVGAGVWTGSNMKITVWGDNGQSKEADGIRLGEQMQFRVLRKSENTEYIAHVRDSLGVRTFITNRMYHLTSLAADEQMGNHFTYISNTGNFAMMQFPELINPTIDGFAIAIGDEIGVFTPSGLCVGAKVWSKSNNAIFIWGDDNQTMVTDGIKPGEQMQFRLWRQSTNTDYSAQATYTKGISTYRAKGIYKLGSLIVPMRVKVKVFLQGPYRGGVMATTLNSAGFIPLNSNTAYDATTYGYTIKTVGSIPNTNIVDWILVELRSGTEGSTKIETQAAFLLKDGNVVDVDGSSDLAFDIASAGNYYIVIRHRNHLAIMTSTRFCFPNSIVYDFTKGQGQAYGSTGLKLLSTGVYGMIGGDANCDGIINGTDFNIYNRRFFAVASGYNETSDFDLSGYVDGGDFNILNPNLVAALSTKVPN